MKSEVMVTGVVALVVVAGLIYLVKSFNGAAIGAQAVGVVTGAVGAVGDSVASVANDPSINPLYNVGTGMSETIFNFFHPGYNTP